MAVTLDDVDVIRERMDVGYADALRALEEAEGDLTKALALIEQWLKEREKEEDSLSHLAEEVISEVQQALQSPVRKIRVRIGRDWVKEFPVALTAAAAVGIALAAFLINRCTIEIERETTETEEGDEG